MALSNELVSQNLGSSISFNWPWFIELVVCGILVLFFLFYFNRLFATIVSYFIRLYTWRTFRVWIDIQAIQISLLGGRIFFKGVRYYGENETILVHSGHITWRYWLRDVKQVDLTRFDVQPYGPDKGSLDDNSSGDSEQTQAKDEEQGSVKKTDKSQARIAVFVSGVEWFIYNRTPMYDAILRETSKTGDNAGNDCASIAKEPISPTDKVKIPTVLRRRQVPVASSSSEVRNAMSSATEDASRSSIAEQREKHDGRNSTSTESDVTLAQSLLVQMLPIYIECNRAAVSMGNHNTKAILVTTITKAKGHIDAGGCGQHDMFRQIFDFEVTHPVVQMRPNPDFKNSQFATAESVADETLQLPKRRPWWRPQFDFRRRKARMISGIYGRLPWLYSSTQSLHQSRDRHNPYLHDRRSAQDKTDGKQWHGLGRYLDENETDDHEAWADIEYGRFSTVLDCPAVHLNFYWDVPGRVRSEHLLQSSSWSYRDINGIAPPAYGLDLTVKGGMINYGPWTDRLRAEMQAIFLPASYRSAVPASCLNAGDWRQSTKMVIRVDLEDEVTLRVPMRERSKDWRWRGRASAVRDAAALRQQREKRHFRFRRGQKSVAGPDIRPFGWLSFAVAADSSVRYEMDMVAGPSGYYNKLQLDLKGTKASSSVNHALLWKCDAQRLDCDLSNPLCWNGPHAWTFNVESDAMQFFLLRDHMFLLTDLISDFTAGQKADYMTFTPFTYKLRLKFADLQILLNANDFNIIDNPCDTESNAFLTLGLHSLDGVVEIPMQHFAPARNSVSFQARGQSLSLKLSTPIWNTLRNFSPDDTMATLEDLQLDGSYTYCTATSPFLTDCLLMNITGSQPLFHLQGFLIRYFMNVKENYFGDFLHYKTLEEHQGNFAAVDSTAEDQKVQAKKDNDLDVILSIRAIESCIMMPAGIYDRSENLRVDVMNVDMDMRFTNYYMDLHIASSPIEASVEKPKDPAKNSREYDNSTTQIYIDHVTVFGHRLFGAPPSEPTYVCHWDIDAGNVLGECSPEFLRITIAAVQSLVYTLEDDQNALKSTATTSMHDVTFVRARSAGLRIWVKQQDTAFLAEIAPFDLLFNDWARSQCSKQVKVFIPKLLVAAVDLKTSRRSIDPRTEQAVTIACLETSINVATWDRNADFEDNKIAQQSHVWFHDLKTKRAAILLDPEQSSARPQSDVSWGEHPANMPAPALPPLLQSHQVDSYHSASQPFDAAEINHQTTSAHPFTLTHTEHIRNHRKPRVDRQASLTAGFSSTWIPPYFPLHGLQPETHELPKLKSEAYPDGGDGDSYQDIQDVPQQEQSLAHGSVVVKFPSGLRGFIDSETSTRAVQLIEAIKDHEPVAIFDSIERETIANVLQLSSRKSGHISDIAVIIPGIAMRLLNRTQHARNNSISCDQYEIQGDRAQMVLRIAPTVAKQSQGRTRENFITAQASIRKIGLNISERTMLHTTGAANLDLSVNDLSVWFSLQEKLQTDVQLGKVQVVTSAATVDKLSLLFQRSFSMLERISIEVKRLQENTDQQDLLYHLALSKTKLQDPSFLSRPSYILRSAEDHVRLDNSWRAIVVLRHRLRSILADNGEAMKASSQYPRPVSDLYDHIVKFLDEEVTGTVDRDSYQPLLKSTLKMTNSESTQSGKVIDSQVALFIGQILLVLDPGPKKSEMSLRSCDLNFSQSPILEREDRFDRSTPQPRASIIVRCWMSTFSVELNWELAELAQSVIDRMQMRDTDKDKVKVQEAQPPVVGASADVELSVLCGTDSATISLNTINLAIALGAKDFKSSLTVLHNAKQFLGTLLVASTSAYTQVTSHATKLLQTSIVTPSVYVAYRRSFASKSEPDAVQVAASCSKLRFSLMQAPAELLHIANLVLAQEVITVQNIIKSTTLQTDESPYFRDDVRRVLPRLQLGLFLEDYKIQIALLPTIQYLIFGKVARTSISPIALSKFVIHIDLKRHKHALLHPGAPVTDAISLFEVPPISGRVLLTIIASAIKVNARGVVEKISVEASAVQACLEAIYNSENAEYVKAIGAALDDCQETVREAANFNKVRQKSQQVSSTEQRISYSAHLVFAGVTISCTSPVRQGQDNNSNLMLEIRSVTAHAYSNKHSGVPDFRLRAPSIGLYLYRTTRFGRRDAGQFMMGFEIIGTQEQNDYGSTMQTYRAHVSGIDLDLFAETPVVAVDIAAYVQEQLRSISISGRKGELKPLRRLTISHNDLKKLRRSKKVSADLAEQPMESSTILQNSIFELEVSAVRARWILDQATPISPGRRVEDLIFSIRKVNLTTQGEDSARLAILDLQIQLAPKDQPDPTDRTRNSALLPEVVFKAAHVSTEKDRRFAFQAAGKALDLRLAADGILPLSAVQKSLAKASIELRALQHDTEDSTSQAPPASISNILGNKRLASLLVDADFAGAVFSVTPRVETSQNSVFELLKGSHRSRAGKYGQAVRSGDANEAVLRAPGMAMKVEYQDVGKNDPSFNMEVKIAASNNTLAPTVVPLVLEIYSSVKEIMGEDNSGNSRSEIKVPAQKYLSEAANNESDPTAVLGRVRLNASLWVQRQEFSLTCQPVARVQATASFDDIFVTINTVQNEEQERFVSILTKFNNLHASVQHVYSRESTAGFEVESIVMSLMNSKHVSAKNGISAILTISPMSTRINARQLQDFLLFREIWYPQELRRTSKPTTPAPSMSESQTYAMQKYQELTATAALPWHAIVSIQELKLQVDFGQALGVSSFTISNLWASSKKSSDWEQNLCVGFDRVAVDSAGRMSGFIELDHFRGRTSIRWPISDASGARAPLVQASLGFGHLRLKAAFDYQPFAVADVSSFEFLMYNVRPDQQQDTDRLVGILDGGKVQAFCISTAGAQVLAIIQAFERLFQEKRDAYQASLYEVERLLRRKSIFPGDSHLSDSAELEQPVVLRGPKNHALHTDVVVTLKAVDIGAFPNTFFDNQILKIEAADAQARFAVATVDDKVRSGLGMSLGQVRLALSSVSRSNTKALGEVEISDVVERATNSRGGTIIKVPRLVASMQTWQQEESNLIEYVFHSTFHGKVDVGWNYSRISFIRGMWDTHSEAMAQRLGKPLAPSAVKITAEDAEEGSGQEKITAVVNMPQSSKYEYIALEPPIIDTPQLRDMGEATPPLEWIGLHRDKLPNVTHSIIIVALLEVAREVEDAYTRILGTG